MGTHTTFRARLFQTRESHYSPHQCAFSPSPSRAISLVFVYFRARSWSILSEAQLRKPVGFSPLRLAAWRRSTSPKTRCALVEELLSVGSVVQYF